MTAIYKITNRLNRKIYVGLTYRSIEKRFLEHSKANTPLGQAMRECGLENFMIEIIEECEALELAKKREQFWIKILNCKVPNGYNQSDGGEIGYSRKPKMQIVKPVFLASPVSDFASRLKDLRCKMGLSQSELALMFGISLRNYQRYESGERKPKFDLIASLAEYFHVSTDYLLGTDTDSDEDKNQLLLEYGRLNSANRRTLLDMARFLNTRQGIAFTAAM